MRIKARSINKTILCILFACLFNAPLFADGWQLLKEGGNLVFIRHALAPGGGDPSNFVLSDCTTQRNLDAVGIKQAQRIGALFRKSQIPIASVFSSQWCRCKDTAYHAFENYEEFSALNSTYSASLRKNLEKQRAALNRFVKDQKNTKENIIFVTHFSIITAVTDAVPSSGEIIITDHQFNLLTTINTSNY